MVRKHRRRTRKRNKRGGSVRNEMERGVIGLQEFASKLKNNTVSGIEGLKDAASQVHEGYRRSQGGLLQQDPKDPATSEVDTETGIVTETPHTLPMEPTNQSTNQPVKEKQGGLLGLGTWFGLGGRRLSHSSFINKMLKVRNKTKRNKAIRKYLKGGKKKTKKRIRRKKRKSKRRRR